MKQKLIYRGYRFPPDIIAHAVWLYHRFTLDNRRYRRPPFLTQTRATIQDGYLKVVNCTTGTNGKKGGVYIFYCLFETG